jgi:hypothetical protein
MISMTWLELANPQFQDAVRVIFDCPMLDAKTSYSAGRIYQGIAKTEADIRKLRMELCSKWAKKDDEGKNVTDPRGNIVFKEDGDQAKFEAEFMEEFQKRKLELKVNKIDFEKLASVRGITPRSWEHLKPIVENLPSEEPEEELPAATTPA